MTKVSIIIVHYNTDEETIACLQSLTRLQTRSIACSITVIDNGSKIPLDLGKKFKSLDLELLRSESNLGFTGGNNLGIKHAIDTYNPDYFLLLNSDTVVAPTFLQEMISKAKKLARPSIMNPKIYFAKGCEYHRNSYHDTELGKIYWYAGGSIDWQYLAAFHRGVDEVDRGQFDNETTSDFVTGCCMLIPREVVEVVGLLNDRLFLYLEDVEYSLRAREAGFDISYCPEAVIWHKNAGSSGGSGSLIHSYYQTRNRLWLAFAYGSLVAKKTAVRLAWHYLKNGISSEKKAVIDALVGNMGKQPVI